MKLNKSNTRPWVRAIEGEGGSGSASKQVESDKTDEGTDDEKVDWQARAAEWKEHARTWEERAKANKDAAERVKKLEDSEKTEMEKIQSQISQLTEQLATEKRNAEQADKARMRADIANEFHLSKEDRDLFLTADDEETLRKQAEKLAARVGAENPLQGHGKSGTSKATALDWANQLLGKNTN